MKARINWIAGGTDATTGRRVYKAGRDQNAVICLIARGWGGGDLPTPAQVNKWIATVEAKTV